MPDERFRIIFEGKERNLDQVLKKLEKAFDQLSDANPFEKINASMAAMGKAMDQVVGKVAAGFGAVQKSLDMLTGTLDKIPVDKTRQLGENVGEVTQKVKGATLAFGNMQGAIGAVAHAAGKAFEAVGARVRGIEEGVGRAIGGTLKGLGGNLGGIGSGQLSGNLLSPLIEGARTVVTTTLKSVDDITQGVISGVRSIVTGASDLLGDLAKAALLAAGGVIGALTPVGPLIGAALGHAVGSFGKMLTDMVSGAVNGVASVVSGISSLVTGALQGVVNVAAGILNSLVGIAQGVVEKVGQAFGALVSKVAGIAGGVVSKFALAFTGLAGVAAAQAVKFRDQMAVTFGLIAQDGTTTFQELTSEVRAIMADTPFISWEEGAKGLFQAISFGVREPQARIDALKASIDLALGGGMRELGTAVQGVARMMDQFGVSAREASDRLYTMQNQASLTVNDLSQGIGQVLGSAKAAGQSLDEVGAALTFISRALPPDETFNALNRLLVGLVSLNPEDTTGPAAVFKSLGVAIRDATGNMRPLSRILADLQAGLVGGVDQGLLRRMKDMSNEELAANLKASGPAGLKITEAFPNTRALRAVLPLIAQAQSEYRKAVDEQSRFAGAAAQAAGAVRERLGAQLSATWASWKGLIDRVVERIEGPMAKALTGLQNYLKEISESAGFNSVADAVGRALTGVVRFVQDGIKRVIDNWPKISAAAETAWGHVTTVIAATGNAIKAISTALKNHLGENPEGKIATAWQKVKDAAEGTWDAIEQLAKGDLRPIEGFFESLWSRFKELAGEAWDTVRLKGLEVFGELANALAGIFGPAADRNVGSSPKVGKVASVSREVARGGQEPAANVYPTAGFSGDFLLGNVPREQPPGTRLGENELSRGFFEVALGPVPRAFGEAVAGWINEVAGWWKELGAAVQEGARRIEDYTAGVRNDVELNDEKRELAKIEREAADAARQLQRELRKTAELYESGDRQREATRRAAFQRQTDAREEAGVLKRTDEILGMLKEERVPEESGVLSRTDRVLEMLKEERKAKARATYSQIKENLGIQGDDGKAKARATYLQIMENLEKRRKELDEKRVAREKKTLQELERTEAAAVRKGQRVFDAWMKSQRQPEIKRTSSVLGFGGPPMGASLDTIRGRERSAGRQRGLHDQLLDSVGEGLRETVLSQLPHRYSLRQLRGAIASVQEMPSVPGRLTDEHQQELFKEAAGAFPQWKDPAAPGGAPSGAPGSAPDRGVPGPMTGLAEKTGAVADATEKGTDKEVSELGNQGKQLDRLKDAVEERADLTVKAIGENTNLIDGVENALRKEINELRQLIDGAQRKATKARDMAS